MKLLDDDMERFSNGDCPPLYHGCLKKIVLPVIVPILHHADQPEKREVFGTKLGKGSNHSRWRYSLNFNEVGHLLPSCDVCKPIIMQRCEKGRHFSTSSLDLCQNCSNWAFLGKNELLKWKPAKSFPSDMVPDSGFLVPMELTTGKLKFAAMTTHREVSSGKWNISTAQSFLSHYCISTRISDRIIDNALNVKLLSNVDRSSSAYNTIVSDSKKHPEKYSLAKLPPLWNSNRPMYSYPESPMHLLSGIVKAVMKLSFKALSFQNKSESFLNILRESKEMRAIESLNIPWFSLMVVKSEKFPGMGAENHLALGRFLKILGLYLKYVKEKTPTIFPPESTQQSWNKSLNIEWLKMRNLETKGDASTVRERVKKNMLREDCPPISIGSSLNKEEIQRVYASTYNALSHLMATSINDAHIEDTHFHILRLLNDIEALDKKLRTLNGSKPIWTEKYNLSCLLNSREDMTRYGPPRCRWEGDDNGEKNVQPIKTEFNGFRSNWELLTHKNYNLRKTLSKLKKIQTKTGTLNIHSYQETLS